MLRLAQNYEYVSRCECWGKRGTANWQLFITVFRVLLSYRFDCFRISSHEMFVFSYGVFIFQFATAWYCKSIQTIIVITFQSILPEISHTSKQFGNLLYSKNLKFNARACCTENETCIPETISFANKWLCDWESVLAFFSLSWGAFWPRTFVGFLNWYIPTDIRLIRM